MMRIVASSSQDVSFWEAFPVNTLQCDSALVGFTSALQVAVLAGQCDAPQDALEHFRNVARTISDGLTQRHLSVLRSLLVTNVSLWTRAVAPHAQDSILSRLPVLLTGSAGQIRAEYSDLLSAVDRALRVAAIAPISPPSLLDSRVANAMACIRTHCTERPLRLDDVAQASNISRWHLERLMKRETDMPFNAHVRAARMDMVSQLLTTTTLSLKEVAVRVGYPHVSELSRDFRRVMGVSPREWKRGARTVQ